MNLIKKIDELKISSIKKIVDAKLKELTIYKGGECLT